MKLSIIIPASGRTSLYHTMQTLMPQLELQDEVLIVGDGPQPMTKEVLSHFTIQPHGTPWRYWELPEKVGDNGAAPRDAAISEAKGTHLMFMDDDDSYNPWALKTVRTILKRDSKAAHIFKMARYLTPYTTTFKHTELWKEPEITLANIGTPMFVVPNKDVPKWVGLPPTHHDFEFIKQYKKEVVFHPEIIARVRS